jgi:hypothetical protein
MAQVVEHLPSSEALNSKPSTTKGKKNKEVSNTYTEL